MKVNIDINTLRKRYANPNLGFVIKIRNQLEEKNRKDIVYYNGIKSFEIKDEKPVEISMPDNIYKLNITNILKNKESIIESTIDLRNDMKNFFPMRMESIKLIVSSSRLLKEKDAKEIFFRLTKLQEKVKEQYSKYFNMEDLDPTKIMNQWKRNLKNHKKVANYEIKLQKKFNENDLEDIKKMVNIEYLFITALKLKEDVFKERALLKIPEFTYKSELENKITNIRELELFEKNIKNSVEKYELNTHVELEKKYQHLFMISDFLFKKCPEFSSIYRFEEEYYTNELAKSEYDRGRLDVLFIKIDEAKKIGELYIIELKVNDRVLGDKNGLHKHYIDIRKLNDFYLENFLTLLEKRLKFRIEILENKKEKITIDRNHLHFWTVISISKEEKSFLENATKVKEKLQLLCDEITVKNNVHLKDNKEEIKPLLEVMKEVKSRNIDVQIYFDLWDCIENTNNLTNVSFFKDLEEFIKKCP